MTPARSLLWLIACAALLIGCWGGVNRAVLATVLFVDGDAVYRAQERSSFKPLTLQANPGAGAVLQTSADAYVDLALVPGALIQVSANTEVEIEELSLRKEGNETDDGMRKRTARVRLKRGSLTIVFERRDDSELRFAIVTSAVTLTADEDCVCQVHMDNGHARVTCVRGKVYVSDGRSEAATVKAGYFQEWPGGSSATAAEDARAQSEVADALEAADRLQKLELAQLNRRPL